MDYLRVLKALATFAVAAAPFLSAMRDLAEEMSSDEPSE